MKSNDSEPHQGQMAESLRALTHPMAHDRSTAAHSLAETGGPEAIEALKRASQTEPNLLCKIEMVRAVVTLERRLGSESSRLPLVEGAEP